MNGLRYVVCLAFFMSIHAQSFADDKTLTGHFHKDQPHSRIPFDRTRRLALLTNINLFKVETGNYPESLEQMLDKLKLPQNLLYNPWQCPYEYVVVNESKGFRLTSLGADCKVGGFEDDVDFSEAGPSESDANLNEGTGAELKTIKSSSFRGVPYKREGKTIGLMLINVKRNEELTRAGLVERDIVLSVNDTPLSSFHDFLQLFTDGIDEPAIALQVERAQKLLKFEVKPSEFIKASEKYLAKPFSYDRSGAERIEIQLKPAQFPEFRKLNDPEILRAVPYFREGAQIGVRLFSINDNSAWHLANIRNGDILLSMNGVPFDRHPKFIVDKIPFGETLTLDLLRGKKIIIVEVKTQITE